MKQPKFLFYLHFFQDLVETMRSVSLKFQQYDLPSCEIPHIIAGVLTSIEALSLTLGPSCSRLMTELHLHLECSYELLYMVFILEKPDGPRDAKEIKICKSKLGSLAVILIVLLFWIYFFFLMLVFVLQWLSLHWEILIMLSQFPLTFQ